MEIFIVIKGHLLPDNLITKKLYLIFLSATNKSDYALNVCIHILARNRYNITEIRIFDYFELFPPKKEFQPYVFYLK